MNQEADNRVYSIMARLSEMTRAYKALPLDYSCPELLKQIKTDLLRVKKIADKNFLPYNQLEAWMTEFSV